MRPDVYISTDLTVPVSTGGQAFGSGWQRIGVLDGSRETEAWQRVRPFIGLGGGRSTGITFWLDGDPDSDFIQGITERVPEISRGFGISKLGGIRFRLALDLRGFHNRCLLTRAPAAFKGLSRRAPEPHPAYFTKPVFLPIHLAAKGGAVFDRLDV